MANLYKNADQRKKIVPGGGDTKQVETVVKAEEKPTEPQNEPVQVENAPVKVAELLDGIGDAMKDLKATYSLYLSKSVMDEVKKRSKAAKMSNGAYLDELLKRVFQL